MQVGLHEFRHPFIEIMRFVVHLQLPPGDSFDVFEPMMPDQLVPHGHGNAQAWIRFEQADPVPLAFIHHSHMIKLRVGQHPLHFGHGVVVSEEQDVARFAILGELFFRDEPSLR